MSTANPTAQISLELLQRLGPLAEQAGIDLPGVTKFAPTIDVTKPIRQLALEIGQLVGKRDIFLRGAKVGTVNPTTGEWRPMTPRRFPGWCEEFCAFSSPGARRVRDSLAVEDAAQILEMDIFLECLRPLEAIHEMRLPVRRAGELWPIEFLPIGYDAESRIYTVERIAYDMTWPLERAVEFINDHGGGYPWAWPEDVTSRDLCFNRSWCVHVAAMLGVYCKEMFPPGVRRPMITYIANQAGSGKSTLVSMVLMPVFGHSDNTKVPKDDDAFNEELNTIAINRRSYLFLDDIGGGIFSNPLNAFITATGRSGRIKGGDTEFRERLQTQVFATGNDIKISQDLMRRSLVAELFEARDIAGRKFARTISGEYLCKEETRAAFLAALCAIVRHFIDHRAKYVAAGQPLPMPAGLETFEEWTSLVSAMVQAAGYNDPLLPPDLTAGGSEDDDEMRLLLVKVATAAEEDEEFDRKELVAEARKLGLLEPLVGTTDDKDLDSTAMKKWGRQLQKWRGRELTDERGRKFRFSHKRQKRGAKYPLAFIKPKGATTTPAPAPATPPPPVVEIPIQAPSQSEFLEAPHED